MDHHFPAFQLEGLAIPREVIGAFAIDLDGREFRRDLVDLAEEVLQRGFHGLAGRARGARRDHGAFLVLAVGGGAPLNGEEVFLFGIHRPLAGLGGLAQRNRQDARGERVERAAMAGLLGIQQPFHDADGLGGGDVDRLVEHKPAMHRVALAFALPRHWKCLSVSPAPRVERGRGGPGNGGVIGRGGASDQGQKEVARTHGSGRCDSISGESLMVSGDEPCRRAVEICSLPTALILRLRSG